MAYWIQSTITRKGQATIPKAVREHLGLKPGDRVRFHLHPHGGVSLGRVRPVTDLKGMVEWDGPPVSIEDMDQAITEGIAERVGVREP